MNSASKRPPIRGSVQDFRLGHDIFLCSAYVSANEFVSVTDDVELVDFVAKDSSKKIWHCYDLFQSLMLRKVVLAAYSEAIDDNNLPEWYSSLLTADLTKPNASGMAKQIRFLGLVSLFNFLLYSFTPETNSTRVHLLLVEHCLALSSLNERILQILQLVQGDQVKTTAFTLNPECDFQENLLEAYISLGFTPSHPSNDKYPSYLRTSMIEMPKFTNRTIWSWYGKFVSLSDKADDDPLLQMFCCTVSHLLLHPMNHNTSIGLRFSKEYITHHVSVLATGMPSDVNLCAKYLRALATSLTRVPLAVITHALVDRMRETKRNDKVMHETTLELVQYISISLEFAVPHHTVFVGDCHSCTLYCEKCHQTFGEKGTIFKVFAEAPHAILYHHGLELTKSNSAVVDDDDVNSQMQMEERRFLISLPMHTYAPFLGQFSLSIIDKLDKIMNQ
jgi:hypothetical protein